jgi:DNA-binding CsgD family transcriptional regulator
MTNESPFYFGNSDPDGDRFYREAVTAMIPELTDLELKICIRLAKGEENDRICKEMHMDARVLDNHRSDIRRKLRLDRKQNLRVNVLALVDEYRRTRKP